MTARMKSEIEDDALKEWGFTLGQSSRLDRQAELAFRKGLRKYSKVPFQWNYVSQESFSLTQGVATLTLPKYVGLISNHEHVRLKQGSETFPGLLQWKDPVDFDISVSDGTQQGRPSLVTNAEFTEQRIIRLWKVPDDTNYSILVSYHRNLEFTSAGSDIEDSDTVVAPEEFEELLVVYIKSRLAPILLGEQDPENVAIQRRLRSEKSDLMDLLPAVDPKISVKPPARTRRMTEGV